MFQAAIVDVVGIVLLVGSLVFYVYVAKVSRSGISSGWLKSDVAAEYSVLGSLCAFVIGGAIVLRQILDWF